MVLIWESQFRIPTEVWNLVRDQKGGHYLSSKGKKSIVLCSYREKLELGGLMKGRWNRKVKEGKWRGTTNTEGL